MKKITKIRTLGLILGYELCVGYLGFVTSISLSSVIPILHSYTILALILVWSHTYLICRLKKSFSLIRAFGSLWFAYLQYGLLLFPFLHFIYAYSPIPLETITLIGIGTLALIFTLGAINAYTPIVREYSITVPKKNASLKTLTIAFASDFHFGVLVGTRQAIKLKTKLQSTNPDLILFGGDIVDDHPGIMNRKKIASILAGLQPKFGKYAVLGNHDVYTEARDGVIEELNQSGFVILEDEAVEIAQSIWLIGRKDASASRSNLRVLMSEKKATLPVILMDHQPTEIPLALSLGVDLTLAGHTHKGQMYPNNILTKRTFWLDYGHRKVGRYHAIVSSGFGFWGPPTRIGTQSEIIKIKVEFRDLTD